MTGLRKRSKITIRLNVWDGIETGGVKTKDRISVKGKDYDFDDVKSFE